MKRLVCITVLGLSLAACGDEPNDDSNDTGSEDGTSTDQDGDGDGDPTGDGDGDPTGDGDGDPTGDGDGDPTGDGDGDPTGDGDGDPTGDGDGDINPSVVSPVAATPENGAISVGHCAIDPGGNIYVAWQQEQNGGQDIWMTQSTDGGQSFEAAIPVENGPDNPIGGWGAARKPYVATDGDRVAVSYGTSPNGYSGVRISTSLAPLTLGPLIEVGTQDNSDVEEFQKVMFTPQGNVWVSWHWTVPDVSEAKAVSREEDGWAYDIASGNGTPGEPCDCCPHDIRVNAAGDTLVAFRNNIDNTRDHWVSRDLGSDGDFGAAVQGSSTNWFIPACPVSGPRLSETQGGTQLLTWADPTSGEGRVWLATSDDGGASWSGDHLVHDAGNAQSLPSITTSAGGRVFIAFDIGPASGQLTASDDDGETFAAPVAVPTADGDLARIELCSGPTRTGMVGVTSANSLWWAGY